MAATTTTSPAALARMVDAFKIPYLNFTLPNNLKVIVLTNRRDHLYRHRL